MFGTVVYPDPPSITGIDPLTLPLESVTLPNFAPPGCLKETLGVKVYPLPEFSTSILEIEPLVTTAFNLAF